MFAALTAGIVMFVAITWPQALGVHRVFGVAQLIAFRPALVVGLFVIALIIGGIALVMKRRTRRVVTLVVAGSFLVAALAQAAVLGARGWGSSSARTANVSTLAQDGLTVLSWNAQGGATSAQDIAALALTVRPDVIALPETDAVAADEVRAILAEHGLTMSSSTVGDRIPTSVLISTMLGSYRLDASRGSTPGLPSGVWLPDDETSPPIVVAHPMPPLPGSMSEWRQGLDWMMEQCQSLGESVVVAGDLNATVDHLGDVPGCSDAAAASSQAASGTWPSTAPQALASPIDHVLLGVKWRVLDVKIVDTPGSGSDHRPIVAVLGS
ncbi:MULTISPECIES: endonuclease/exonuclease/phosphatase family protein [unclassified Microbacterium]|uniref:endonuclease/exonuclease/phosphatase family protein n=1 Tax=unclassified Microbacterium TaxID=2609290 RepID=UPI0012F795BB|nr:endonuclease/exonuclease/phosphatase family protein [Microbacterium sp. MAH-37]